MAYKHNIHLLWLGKCFQHEWNNKPVFNYCQAILYNFLRIFFLTKTNTCYILLTCNRQITHPEASAHREINKEKTMSAVGLNNGNFRSGEYRLYVLNVQDTERQKAEQKAKEQRKQRFNDVVQEIRDSFSTQAEYDAWWKASPERGFFAYAEDYLIQIKLEDAEIIAKEKFATEWGDTYASLRADLYQF